MAIAPPRTVEATYENGLLRPLEPIHDTDGQVYFVTILNVDSIRSKKTSPRTDNLRGKYRGFLTSAEDFARNKQTEKALEL